MSKRPKTTNFKSSRTPIDISPHKIRNKNNMSSNDKTIRNNNIAKYTKQISFDIKNTRQNSRSILRK